MRRPAAVIAVGYLTVVVLATVCAGALAPYQTDDQDLSHALTGPSSAHLLGAGELGRDVLTRLLYGGRVTLTAALIAGTLYVLVGVPAGVAAGYFRGWTERFVLRIADILFAVPQIVILLVVVAIFPGNETAAMVTLGLLGAPGLARIVRSVTVAIRGELYVSAARVAGLGPWRIIGRHVLPRVAAVSIVQTALFAATAVLLETGLGFLGLGDTRPTWGGMIAEASRNLSQCPWLLVPSGTCVIAFILALGVVGDLGRDAVSLPSARATRPPTRRQGSGARASSAVSSSAVPSSAVPDGALLSVEGLTVAFNIGGEDTPVVSGVDLTVRAGEAVGLVGESGCGKSVTALSILGLVGPGRVTGGQIALQGEDLLAATSQRLREIRGSRIGWVSQEPILSLDPRFTIGSQLVEAVRAHESCGRRAARQRALALMDRVHLPDPAALATRYPHQLSGGMAQRVGIAAALACDPVLLIADEPTTALDVTVQAEILDLFRGLRDDGMALVLVSHDWGVVSDICDRAVVMYAGQVVEQGAVIDLVHRPLHPYTKALLAADPHRGTPGTELDSIAGVVPPPGSWPTGCRFQDRCSLARPECASAPVPMEAVTLDRATRCLRHEVLAIAPSIHGCEQAHA
jgi:peptide/nickel transport system permease protein